MSQVHSYNRKANEGAKEVGVGPLLSWQPAIPSDFAPLDVGPRGCGDTGRDTELQWTLWAGRLCTLRAMIGTR
jgi:hypothetical protein